MELTPEQRSDLDSLPRHTIKRVMSPEEASALIGKKVTDQGEPLRGFGVWYDEDTGEPVIAVWRSEDSARFRKAVLSSQDGQTSVTFGYRPRKPMMKQESCRLAVFNRQYPDAGAYLAHYSELLSAQLSYLLPEVASTGQEEVSKVYGDWRLGDDSLWTSGVINRLSQLPYHQDRNNFDAWSVMPVIRRGAKGGGLNIPEYGITFPARDSTVVAFYGKSLVHGVTPMEKTAPDGYRISVVFYALKGLKNCHDFAAETAYGRARRTEREEELARVSADRYLAGVTVVIGEDYPHPSSGDGRIGRDWNGGERNSFGGSYALD